MRPIVNRMVKIDQKHDAQMAAMQERINLLERAVAQHLPIGSGGVGSTAMMAERREDEEGVEGMVPRDSHGGGGGVEEEEVHIWAHIVTFATQ